MPDAGEDARDEEALGLQILTAIALAHELRSPIRGQARLRAGYTTPVIFTLNMFTSRCVHRIRFDNLPTLQPQLD